MTFYTKIIYTTNKNMEDMDGLSKENCMKLEIKKNLLTMLNQRITVK